LRAGFLRDGLLPADFREDDMPKDCGRGAQTCGPDANLWTVDRSTDTPVERRLRRR
jgi:hypothetical protein